MKKIFIVYILMILSGCAATSNTANYNESTNIDAQEKIYIATNNSGKLIELYKSQLMGSDNRDYRIKLANAYLNALDAESALFTMNALILSGELSFDAALVSAKAYLELGQLEHARNMLDVALKIKADSGEVYNLLGIIDAHENNFDSSRAMFNLARKYFFDDTKIKNNISLLDLMEGQHDNALKIISTLDEDGLQDAMIRSNVMFIMAKSGNREYVLDSLDPALSDIQKENIYLALRSSNYSFDIEVSDLKIKIDVVGVEEKPVEK